jgi:hypothetical protein
MTERQDKLLREHLRELGDLSGIVHDLNSDEVIGGNQRSRIMRDGAITIERTHEPATRTGTVAEGFVVWEGERYSYRQVRWSPEQCAKANIVANHDGGDWDHDILANNFDVADLLKWGFEEGELGIPGFGDGEGDGEESGDQAEREVECPKCGHTFVPGKDKDDE